MGEGEKSDSTEKADAAGSKPPPPPSDQEGEAKVKSIAGDGDPSSNTGSTSPVMQKEKKATPSDTKAKDNSATSNNATTLAIQPGQQATSASATGQGVKAGDGTNQDTEKAPPAASTESKKAVTETKTKEITRPEKSGKRPSKTKTKKHQITPSDSEDSSSSNSSSSEEETPKKKSKKAKKAQKAKKTKKAKSKRKEDSDSDSDDEDSSSSEEEEEAEKTTSAPAQPTANVTLTVKHEPNDSQVAKAVADAFTLQLGASTPATNESSATSTKKEKGKKKDGKVIKGSKAEFVRVDRIWSTDDHRFKTQPSTEDKVAGKYDAYAFNVVRRFDYQNRYTSTELVIIGKPLKKALVHVVGSISGLSLEEDKPTIDPNMVFLHLEQLRSYVRELRKKSKKARKKRDKADRKAQSKQLKVLVKYLDEDYDETKKTLEPLLANGKITFDLCWALFKSNDIVFLDVYNNESEHRAAKVEFVSKEKGFFRGEYYSVDLRFLDYDGEKFGMASMNIEIEAFKGARNISKLPLRPVKYHPDSDKLKQELIERGKKFTSLEGMHYKIGKGLAFYKKDNKIFKVSMNGRIMIDPKTFRRLRPNYQFCSIKPEDPDLLDDSCLSSASSTSSESSGEEEFSRKLDDSTIPTTRKQYKKWKKEMKKRMKKMIVEDSDEPGMAYETKIYVPDPAHLPEDKEPLENTDEDGKPKFTDEDYLIASPVVLGFSFVEKQWLEFSISGVSDITWNEGAFDSLIIPDDQKLVVRSLVESHALEAEKNIDDVIQGKGRGLVAVLHGPPGTGKTLTAEGIAELLKKPLYSVSVGELGVNSSLLEKNLTQILDVAHTWGALLLLDEADVFLEQRTNYDVSRNALVSIFLRMLEYFQGILVLTTNRVSVFDPAFASRIHIGLRYGTLDIKARKKVWAMFLDKVRQLEGAGGCEEITDEEMGRLSRFDLNGREIKNAVRTAQSVALIKKEMLGMKHLLQVLLVGNVFAKDLKGAGYEEALKFYT